MVDEPDAAVSVPIVQVVLPAPPVATRPAGRLSVKLKIWAPLPEGWVTVKIRLVLPPTVRSPLKALFTVGVAASTDTQAPEVGVVPLVALGVMAEVMLVVPVMLTLVLAFGVIAQEAMVGVADARTGTVTVQLVCAAPMV